MFKFKEWVSIWENELFISRERVYNKREQKYILRGNESHNLISLFTFALFKKKPYKFTNIHILNVQMQCMPGKHITVG